MGWMDEKTLRDISQSYKDNEALLEKRLAAFQEFQKLRMPTMNDEEWRYTDMGKIKWDSFHPRNADYRVNIGCRGNVYGKPLREAVEKYPEIIKGYMGKSLGERKDKLAYMASAFWNAGYLIYVPKNTPIDEPVSIEISSSGLTLTNILIVVEPGSSVKVVEDCRSSNGGMNVGLVELFIGDSSKVDYYSFQDFGPSHFDLSLKRAVLGSNAHIDWNFGAFGGSISKAKIETFFEGPGSSAEQRGVFLGSGEQHHDILTNAFHKVPHTTNNITVRGVLLGSSSSIYRGLIRIEKPAQQTNSYLNEHSLMMGEHALANSIPSLEIEANEVKASHGSTTGKVDEEQMFYLMSRGLSRKDAERLIIEGFFNPVIEKIPLDAVRQRIINTIERKMA